MNKKTYTKKQIKTYTKKQITEAIKHWKKVLNESKESDAYERSCIPQIAKYILKEFPSVQPEEIFIDDGSRRISPLPSNVVMNAIREMNSYGFKRRPSRKEYNYRAQMSETMAIVRFDETVRKNVPDFDKYIWFIFHTGYMNSNSDILVAHRNKVMKTLSDQWSIQNIELKRYASSYLFQPQLTFPHDVSGSRLEITGISHAYLDQFNQNTKELESIIIDAIHNDPQYSALPRLLSFTSVQWLDHFLDGAEYKVLMKDIIIPNVEETVKKFYFDGYDMNRQVSVFQIGSGKNARLFKVSNVKSTPKTDPLNLLKGKTNTFSSAFNTILMNVEVRKMNGKIKVFGKLRFSNRKANITGSFDPDSSLPE